MIEVGERVMFDETSIERYRKTALYQAVTYYKSREYDVTADLITTMAERFYTFLTRAEAK